MVAAESKTEALHLFRALLRASTYLPDELARTYIRSHITHRFQNASAITPERLRNGRQSLSILKRAADGEQKCLLHVLNLTYGRTGRRRRELMNKIWLPADGSNPSKAFSKTSAGVPDGWNKMKENIPQANLSDKIKEDSLARKRLNALLQSQSQNPPIDSPRTRLRHIKPTVPFESAWGRPLPLKRQKNIISRFWADVLDRVLPPMPERYWNRLRDLSKGVIPFEGVPARRAAAQTMVFSVGDKRPEETSMGGAEGGEKSRLTPAHMTAPIRHVERHPDVNWVRNRHKITPRMMRRLWGTVWNSSPLMVHDETHDKWIVKWGSSRSATSRGEITTAGTRDLELFEGLRGKDALIVDEDTQRVLGAADTRVNSKE